MKDLEKRLAALEKKLAKSEEIDAETINRVMGSGIFPWMCLALKKKFGRELTDKEKVALAISMYKSGRYSFTTNDFVRLIIEMDAEARKKEGNK